MSTGTHSWGRRTGITDVGRRVSEVCCSPCETTRGVHGYSQLGPQDGDNRRLAAARATDECNGVRRDDVRPDFSGGISRPVAQADPAHHTAPQTVGDNADYVQADHAADRPNAMQYTGMIEAKPISPSRGRYRFSWLPLASCTITSQSRSPLCVSFPCTTPPTLPVPKHSLSTKT